MLTGQPLGKAIERAIALKGITKKAVADHFHIKPPSIDDWCKRGTIAKDKLPGLWALFADVVGPEHWGLDRYPSAKETDQLLAAPDSSEFVSAHRETLQVVLIEALVRGHDSMTKELGQAIQHAFKTLHLDPMVGLNMAFDLLDPEPSAPSPAPATAKSSQRAHAKQKEAAGRKR